MQFEVSTIAHEAAEALSAEFGPELLRETERVLKNHMNDRLKVDVGDVVGIATLIVSLAQLAVMLYQGATDSGAKTPDEIQKKLTARVVAQTHLSSATAKPMVIQIVTAMFRNRSDS